MNCTCKAIRYYWRKYLKVFVETELRYMNLTQLIFFQQEDWLGVHALKNEQVKLKLLTDGEMLLMVEKGIRAKVYSAYYVLRIRITHSLNIQRQTSNT